MRSTTLLLALALSACATVAPPDDQLAAKLQGYYGDRAVEEEGRCGSPVIAAISHRKVLASNAEQTRLRVRYGYYDPNQGETADWGNLLQSERTCSGIAKREFTLRSTQLGYQVIDMSGPRRASP